MITIFEGYGVHQSFTICYYFSSPKCIELVRCHYFELLRRNTILELISFRGRMSAVLLYN